MRIFREYMLVGGMPQSVVAYLETGRDFYASDEEKREILNIYRDDIRKASRKYKIRVSALFENIPAYLSTHSYIIHPKSYQSQGDVEKIPPYMLFCII